ncbi:uncharacterized protein B0H64DRAFT_140188 [Chaetomium fimeti]|uniref:Uncharacterized protein n=1 Tax=Chaetomium fimeti TaxID=1854472 RepID=A0AAE0HEM0_9PEZI|nr:hypothetical protein B0H64DRAFT_140188 [Chaetomium fimeti]
MCPRHRWRCSAPADIRELKTTGIGYRGMESKISEFTSSGSPPGKQWGWKVLVESHRLGNGGRTLRLLWTNRRPVAFQRHTKLQTPEVKSTSTRIMAGLYLLKRFRFPRPRKTNPSVQRFATSSHLTAAKVGHYIQAPNVSTSQVSASRCPQTPITANGIHSVIRLRYPLLHTRKKWRTTCHDSPSSKAGNMTKERRTLSPMQGDPDPIPERCILATFSGAKPGTSTSLVTEHAALEPSRGAGLWRGPTSLP